MLHHLARHTSRCRQLHCLSTLRTCSTRSKGDKGDSIQLQGMTFFGYHGVFPPENQLGQRFVVDLTMWCDLAAAGASDDLQDTVNYADVFRETQAIVEGPPYQLIETVAHTVAARVLEQQQRVSAVRVVVSKPHVAIPGVLRNVAVDITRKR